MEKGYDKNQAHKAYKAWTAPSFDAHAPQAPVADSMQAPGTADAPRAQSLDPGAGKLAEALQGLLKVGDRVAPSEPSEPQESRSKSAPLGPRGARTLRPSAGSLRKAAELLVLLGKDYAAQVLSLLEEDEVELLAREIAAVGPISAERGKTLLNEFRELAGGRSSSMRGGPEVARSFLQGAFGTVVADRLYARVEEAGRRRFAFLEDLDPEAVVPVLRDESPGVLAAIFAHLDRAYTARVVSGLPSELRTNVLRRLAGMKKLDMELMARVEDALREKLHRHARPEHVELDGTATIAEILRHMDYSNEESLLRELREAEPELADEIEGRLMTLDVLDHIEVKDLAVVLREFEDKSVALILKGKDEQVRAKMLRGVSERRATIIIEEYRHMGPVLRSDVDSAVKEFLERIKALEVEGKITLRRPGDVYL